MKTILFLVQILSALFLLSAKYFLAKDNPLGWWLSVVGYLLLFFYNIKAKLPIYALVVLSIALLSTYGAYKWYTNLSGLGVFDYSVIVATILTALLMAKENQKRKNKLWQHQTIGTFLFMGAYLLIGLNFSTGWVLMFIGHALNSYIYTKTKGYVYVILQVLSAYIALGKLFPYFPLPF